MGRATVLEKVPRKLGLPPKVVSVVDDSYVALDKLLLKPPQSFKTTRHRPRIRGESEDKKPTRPLGRKDQSCHRLELIVLKCPVSKHGNS